MGIHKLFQLLIISIFSLLLKPSISLTGYEPGILRSENRAAELFQQWREKHGKIYLDDEEMANRFEKFKVSLKYVVKRRSGGNGFTVGLNRFADLSNEEFKAIWFGKVKRRVGLRLSQRRHVRLGEAQKCEAPLVLDWRIKGSVRSVKDQDPSGNEGISSINKEVHASFSGSPLLVDGDDGRKDNAFIIEYPYTDVHVACDPSKVADEIVQVDDFEHVEESDNALLCATVYQPIRVGVHGSSIDFQLYTGGIYDGECSSNPEDIDHAVLIVGYGSKDGDDYWIVKNSWGSGWGRDGYMYIRRNTNLQYGVCAINALASYPTQISLTMSRYLSDQPLSSPPQPSSPPLSPPITPPHSPPPPTPPLSPPAAPPPPSLYPSSPPPTPSPSPLPPSPPLPSPSPPPLPPPSSPTPPPPSPPPSPYHPIPPSPPPPFPTYCGAYTYCNQGQTCCCLYEAFGYCLIKGCCDYAEGVCCSGTDYCCPREYPICATYEGICLKKSRDYLGVSAKKKKMAKVKLPWSKHESKEMTYQPLQWRRAAIR